jgi:hypothetical protein
MAIYEMDDLFAGRRQALSSELVVYCYVGHKWAFEYRFTSPKAANAGDTISAFMASLPWTIPE